MKRSSRRDKSDCSRRPCVMQYFKVAPGAILKHLISARPPGTERMAEFVGIQHGPTSYRDRELYGS